MLFLPKFWISLNFLGVYTSVSQLQNILTLVLGCVHQIINHEEQNVTLTCKIKSQGHSANALNSGCLEKYLLNGVDLHMFTNITIRKQQNVTLTFKVKVIIQIEK